MFDSTKKLVFILVSIVPWCQGTQAAENATGFPLAEVIQQVKTELKAAQDTTGGMQLDLQSVEVTLSVAKIRDINGKVTIGVPIINAEIGGSRGSKATEALKLYVKLEPPKPDPRMSNIETAGLGLTEAIVDARRQFQEAMDGEPRLDPKSLKFDIQFAVENKGGGKGKISFLIFTFGGGAEWTATSSNTVSLTFSPKIAP